jgi:Rod binding domain-containing protein
MNLPALDPSLLATGSAGAASPERPGPDPRLLKAAQEFEAVFIRQLLRPLEKAGETGGGGAVASGSGIYGSLMVSSMADSASRGGGIGLSQLVLEALTRGQGSK